MRRLSSLTLFLCVLTAGLYLWSGGLPGILAAISFVAFGILVVFHDRLSAARVLQGRKLEALDVIGSILEAKSLDADWDVWLVAYMRHCEEDLGFRAAPDPEPDDRPGDDII